jgi:hypothetical protein
MANAGLNGVNVAANIVINVANENVLRSDTDCSNMHIEVLHTEECFVEAPDLLYEAASPDRPGRLPDALQTEKPQQIVAGCLRVIDQTQIIRGIVKYGSLKNREIKISIAIHHFNASSQAVPTEEIVGIQKHNQVSTGLAQTDVTAHISASLLSGPSDKSHASITG